MTQFTPLVVTIHAVPVTFSAESLTPQETVLRDTTSDLPYSQLQTAKVGFSAPNQSRPNSFILSRVYKTPLVGADGVIKGVIRTDIKTTVPLSASSSDRAKHVALVGGIEDNSQVTGQVLNLTSWF